MQQVDRHPLRLLRPSSPRSRISRLFFATPSNVTLSLPAVCSQKPIVVRVRQIRSSPSVKCLLFSKTALRKASSPLNCHAQRMVSVQKPFCFSSRVPCCGSPVPRQVPIKILKRLQCLFRALLRGRLGSRGQADQADKQ